MAAVGPPPLPDRAALAEIESHAVALAASAGALLLTYFGRPMDVTYKTKGHANPVTEADHASEKLLMDGIHARFPTHAVLSEEAPESPDASVPYLWVLDPLDGTTNFLNHFPLWGVSIGVLHYGRPVAGALFIPALAPLGGHVLHASHGGGAFLGDMPVKLLSDEAASDRRLSALPAYVWGQFRMKRELRRAIGELRTTGSIACEMALAATGSLQFAAFGGPKIWDVAGGAIIVKEAGGQVVVRTAARQWKPLDSFLEPGSGLPKDGDLRKWQASLLAGGPASVQLMASGLRPRRGLRLRRWLRRILRGR